MFPPESDCDLCNLKRWSHLCSCNWTLCLTHLNEDKIGRCATIRDIQSSALSENRQAFKRIFLVPRMMRNVMDVDLHVDIFGQRLSMPIFVSPAGESDTHKGALGEVKTSALPSVRTLSLLSFDSHAKFPRGKSRARMPWCSYSRRPSRNSVFARCACRETWSYVYVAFHRPNVATTTTSTIIPTTASQDEHRRFRRCLDRRAQAHASRGGVRDSASLRCSR